MTRSSFRRDYIVQWNLPIREHLWLDVLCDERADKQRLL